MAIKGDNVSAFDPQSTQPEVPHSVPEHDSGLAASELVPRPLAAAPDYLLTIGDIGITSTQIVTPNGVAPLRGSQWMVIDQSSAETKTPTWAIIVAILIFWFTCFLGLLLLLVKETRFTGYVNVNVRSGELVHTAQIPVTYANRVAEVRGSVAQAQSLAAAAA
jgi:hypothetical protein